MLRELKIENLAIIDKLDLEFEDGLIALTGETGAGKSIIIEGINLLIGEKASVDMIRDGSETLLAQGVFEITQEQSLELENQGIELEGNEVIVRRSLDRTGRGKAFVNGVRVPMTSLKEIMSTLVDIVGQHSHQMLLTKSNHIKLLDKFLGEKGKALKLEIGNYYEKYTTITDKIFEIENLKKEISEKREFYEFQLEEILRINPVIGEDIKLEEEYKILFNAGKIKEKLQSSEVALKEGELNALTFIHSSKKSLELLCKYGLEFKDVFERLDKIYYELEDITNSINSINNEIESDDNKLEKVIIRLDEINKLKLKYGSTVEQIVEHKDKISSQLNLLEENNFELKSLVKEKEKIQEEYYIKAEELTKLRKLKGDEIEKNLKSELTFLSMKEAEFSINYEKIKGISVNGVDSVEFFISTNMGQTAKPLWKIASGGEVSRIMLALKVIFSEVDDIAMLLFDEIDSGVGGETVKKIADKLKEIGDNSQVICITHSPVIASKSKQQFYIEKKNINGKTISSVKVLNEKERIQEIARMLAGNEASEAVINHAKELLNVR
ncbi:MAG: DNA repair protein RecN [Fusobacteriaceae bacterium]